MNVDILKLKEALEEVHNICSVNPVCNNCPFYSRKYGDCIFNVTTHVYPKDWELDELGE